MGNKIDVAINAVRAGDRITARRLWGEIVQGDPKNELAWLWLTGCVDLPDQKRYCLERALTINPANERARGALAQLERPAFAKSANQIAAPAALADLSRAPQPSVLPQNVAAVPLPIDEARSPRPSRRLRSGNVLFTIGSGLFVVWLITVAMFLLSSVKPDTGLSASDPSQFHRAAGRVQLVEFYTNDCTYCRQVAPVLAGLEKKYTAQILFSYLNAEDSDNISLVREFKVIAVPWFVLLDKQGKVLGYYRGSGSAEEFETFFRQYINL